MSKNETAKKMEEMAQKVFDMAEAATQEDGRVSTRLALAAMCMRASTFLLNEQDAEFTGIFNDILGIMSGNSGGACSDDLCSHCTHENDCPHQAVEKPEGEQLH